MSTFELCVLLSLVAFVLAVVARWVPALAVISWLAVGLFLFALGFLLR